jgi:hypothetical protein
MASINMTLAINIVACLFAYLVEVGLNFRIVCEQKRNFKSATLAFRTAVLISSPGFSGRPSRSSLSGIDSKTAVVEVVAQFFLAEADLPPVEGQD